MTKEEALKQIREWDFLNDEERAVLETLIPKLRESEDERIRKIIIKHFKEIANRNEQSWINLDIPYILAYLERQKERGPLTKEEEYELHRIIEFLEDETCPSKWISLLHDISCLPYKKYEEQTEQKPVEYLDKDMVYAIMTKLTNLSYSQLIPFNSDEYKKIHEITSDVRSLLDYPIEQKPADLPAGFYVTLDGKKYYAKEMRCNGMNVKVVEPKPAEWSDEDRLHYVNVLEALEYVKGCKSDYDKIEAVKSDIAWLKSLRPSWKPSEEQMNALNFAITYMFSTKANPTVLRDLYNDLLKLK